MSVNLASFAETANLVNVNTDPTNLESKLLKKQYSGYIVTYKNNGKEPLLINNIRGENLIGDMNKINESCKFSKVDYTMQSLGIVTLGLTSVVNMCVRLNNMQKSTAEAVKYANTQLIRAKNEILMPQQTIAFYILVPIGQKPFMTAIFQGTKSNEYISVETQK